MPVKQPPLLNKLPCSDASIKLLQARHNELLLRLFFKTADRHDASELYTHLALCWLLVPNFNEQKVAYGQLAKGALYLDEYASSGSLDKEEFDELTDIFDFTIEIIKRSKIAEITEKAAQLKSGKANVVFKFPED